MKISIDVDIEASEIPLATELLTTLRSLTEHIRVRQLSEKEVIPNGYSHSPEKSRSPEAEAQTSANSAGPPPPAAPAPGPQEMQLSNYIRSATSNFGNVVKNLENALASADPAVEKLFLAAFTDVVLDDRYLHGDEDLQQEHSLYISLLGELSIEIRRRISQALVAVLVKKLVDRKLEPRTALMLPAMVYAHLVLLDMANVKGTLKMVERFLTNGHEAVGLTMLGKTAEMCIDKVLQHASPSHLASLTAALDKLGSQYNYDVEYLNGFIRWQKPCFRVLTCRQQIHTDAISALAFDPNQKQLISASRDGMVLIWDEWANVIQKHVIPNAYAIAMAILPEQREVILVGQPNGNKAGTVACIAAIGLDAPYQMKGPWPRPRTTIISCVIALPGHQQFATGETQKAPGDSQISHATCIYDCASLQSGADLQPTTTLPSTTGAVMCLSGYGASKQVVLAGTRGGQVALWAIANPVAPVKIFSMPDSAGTPLCLDYDGQNTILAGTSHKMLVQWDMNQMAAGGSSDPLPYVRSWQVDPYPVLKVLIWPSKVHGIHAAILTSHGCWVAQLSTDPSIQPNVKHVQDVQNDDCSFSAGAWAGHYPYLYVGGQSQKINVCQLVPEQ